MKRYIVLEPKEGESEQFYVVAERNVDKNGNSLPHGIKEALCSTISEDHANSIAYALNQVLAENQVKVNQ